MFLSFMLASFPVKWVMLYLSSDWAPMQNLHTTNTVGVLDMSQIPVELWYQFYIRDTVMFYHESVNLIWRRLQWERVLFICGGSRIWPLGGEDFVKKTLRKNSVLGIKQSSGVRSWRGGGRWVRSMWWQCKGVLLNLSWWSPLLFCTASLYSSHIIIILYPFTRHLWMLVKTRTEEHFWGDISVVF